MVILMTTKAIEPLNMVINQPGDWDVKGPGDVCSVPALQVGLKELI